MSDVRSSDEDETRARAITPALFWISGALIVALLIAVYWFFIRDDFVPVLTKVPAEEAAEVVKVLDAKKIPYRLADEGTTILIPGSEADKARLELIGSELPIRGQVGFELFNQSDMGLTEFAQKINFQRALQGELARTILLLDGIRSVRVHLGLAERKIFRDEQSPPKASVTLILKPGASLTEGRVAGIQRLVAGAVPDMTAEAVAVLDGSGKVVSGLAAGTGELASASDAVLENYRQRVNAAIRSAQPWLRFKANVSLRMRERTIDPRNGVGEIRPPRAAPRGDPDYVLNVRITTASQLDEQVRLELIHALRSAADIDGGRGDTLVFLVGDPIDAPMTDPLPVVDSDRVVAKTADVAADRSAPIWTAPWLWGGGAVLAVILLITILLSRRPRPQGSELQSFADQLRQRIATSPEPGGG